MESLDTYVYVVSFELNSCVSLTCLLCCHSGAKDYTTNSLLQGAYPEQIDNYSLRMGDTFSGQNIPILWKVISEEEG